MLLRIGVVLPAHWVTFFVAIKFYGVAVAAPGFACFPAFTIVLDVLWFRAQISVDERI